MSFYPVNYQGISLLNIFHSRLTSGEDLLRYLHQGVKLATQEMFETEFKTITTLYMADISPVFMNIYERTLCGVCHTLNTE